MPSRSCVAEVAELAAFAAVVMAVAVGMRVAVGDVVLEPLDGPPERVVVEDVLVAGAVVLVAAVVAVAGTVVAVGGGVVGEAVAEALAMSGAEEVKLSLAAGAVRA